MKFPEKEISLCKQVAEKHRKEIGEGDWVVHVNSDHPTLVRDKESILYLNNKFQLPLWTISDCLEFFFQKGWQLEEFFKNGAGTFSFHINKGEEDYHFEVGKTPLEACLKAVLAVFDEETASKKANQE